MPCTNPANREAPSDSETSLQCFQLRGQRRNERTPEPLLSGVLIGVSTALSPESTLLLEQLSYR